MIVISVDPYVELFSLEVPLYALLLFLAVALGFSLVLTLAKQYGVAFSHVLGLCLVALPGGLVGARLLHVIDQADFYLANPALAPAFWLGGFSQYGLIIGGVATSALYARVQRLPFVRFLDLIPVPLLAGLSLGRVGCIIQGCCYGSPTTLPWGFIYTHPRSFLPSDWIANRISTHPVPLYEIAWFLALLGILLAVRRHLRGEGVPFLVFLIGHSIGRFTIFFFRGDPSLFMLAGLAQAQVIALVVLLVSVALLVAFYRRAKFRR